MSLFTEYEIQKARLGIDGGEGMSDIEVAGFMMFGKKIGEFEAQSLISNLKQMPNGKLAKIAIKGNRNLREAVTDILRERNHQRELYMPQSKLDAVFECYEIAEQIIFDGRDDLMPALDKLKNCLYDGDEIEVEVGDGYIIVEAWPYFSAKR